MLCILTLILIDVFKECDLMTNSMYLPIVYLLTLA